MHVGAGADVEADRFFKNLSLRECPSISSVLRLAIVGTSPSSVHKPLLLSYKREGSSVGSMVSGWTFLVRGHCSMS
jgi:hypothetical protein